MGRDYAEITITMSLSNHNSDQDDNDKAAAERLGVLVRKLIEDDPELESIVSIVMGP